MLQNEFVNFTSTITATLLRAPMDIYCHISNISGTLVGNKFVDDYIFILYLTPGFNGLGKGNCKMKWETFEFGDLVQLILEIWW